MPLTDLQFATWVYNLYWHPEKFDKIVNVAGNYTGIKFLPDCTLIIDRGSVTRGDWLRDLLSQVCMVQTEYGGIGDGFNIGMDQSDDAIIPFVDHSKPIIQGGHSLGGSHADRRAASWRKRFPDANLTLIKFGSPQTGDQKFRSSLAGIPIRSYVNGDDEVTRLPVALPNEPFMQTAKLIPIYAEPINYDPAVTFKFHHFQLYVAAMTLMEIDNAQ